MKSILVAMAVGCLVTAVVLLIADLASEFHPDVKIRRAAVTLKGQCLIIVFFGAMAILGLAAVGS